MPPEMMMMGVKVPVTGQPVRPDLGCMLLLLLLLRRQFPPRVAPRLAAALLRAPARPLGKELPWRSLRGRPGTTLAE